MSELVDHIQLLEYGINTVIPLYLSFAKVAVRVMEIADFLQGLNEQELLLPLAQELDALLIAADDHAGEHFVALPF